LISALAVNIILAFALIPTLGAIGAALSFLLSVSAMSILSYKYVKKSIGLNIFVDIKKLVLPLPVFLVLYYIASALSFSKWETLFSLAGVYFFYLFLLLKLGFFDKKDAQLLDYIPKMVFVDKMIKWVKGIIEESGNRTKSSDCI
jgi:O-antigen/teichoic acid export membrane protein